MEGNPCNIDHLKLYSRLHVKLLSQIVKSTLVQNSLDEKEHIFILKKRQISFRAPLDSYPNEAERDQSKEFFKWNDMKSMINTTLFLIVVSFLKKCPRNKYETRSPATKTRTEKKSVNCRLRKWHLVFTPVSKEEFLKLWTHASTYTSSEQTIWVHKLTPTTNLPKIYADY